MSEQPARSNSNARRTAEDRRETIIAAARRLFAQYGFHNTGMAQIALASKVLVGQIYRDFAGKEELIAAIVERDISELLDDPELEGAVTAGRPDRLNAWVRGFIRRDLDRETRSVLADILSEATRNPRFAAMVTRAHNRLRERLTSAAMVWAPAPDKAAAREELADLILTVAGAMQHRNIWGLPVESASAAKLLETIEAEIAELSR